MTSNLRLVVQATERDATKLATESLSYRLTQRGLTNSWRAIEAEDGGLQVALELNYSEVLQEALLDLLEAEVILVKLLAHKVEVESILRNLIPWKVEH